MSEASAYVGLDVHKDTISVAIAEAGRDGEIRLWGKILHTPPSIDNMGGLNFEVQQTGLRFQFGRLRVVF